MLSQYNFLPINRITVSVGAFTLYGCYTIAALASRRVRNSFYAWKNSGPSLPTLPREIQNVIINAILESNSDTKWHELLQLSLVCKSWDGFIRNHSAWAQNDRQYLEESYVNNCSVFSSKIRSYWLQGKNQMISGGPTVLDPTKSTQYEQYTPWMSHNIIKYPEILFKYLKSVIMVPGWMYFLIVGRVRSRQDFYRNEKNVKRILKIQRLLFVFTTAIPFVATLASILQTTLLPHFMNSSSIWTALWTTPRLAVGSQLRLLAILFAFLPFDFSSFLMEVYMPRVLLILAMFVANGGLPIFAAATGGAFALRKITVDSKDIIPLPYWVLAFLIAYPFSTAISMVVMGIFYASSSNHRSMKPSLQSFRSAKYWLIFGVVVLGIAMLV